MRHRPSHWKCASCNQIKEAAHFASFDLHSVCKECQAETSGYTGTAPDDAAGSDRAAVPARKVYRKPRPSRNTWQD
jgi:hypothetical protein